MFSNLMISSASAGIEWRSAGASIYGGECGSGNTGYKGDNLEQNQWSFAELNMGTALGGLPYKTRVRVLDPGTKRKTWITKLDIGGGGGPVEGVAREFDLYSSVARWLSGADCNWTGVILWRKEMWFDHAQSRHAHGPKRCRELSHGSRHPCRKHN